MIPSFRTVGAALLALALVASACSSGPAEVATIGNTTITESDLAELYESKSIPIDAQARDTIFALVAKEVLTQGLEDDFGATIDAGEVDTMYGTFIDQMESQGRTPEELLGVSDASREMIRFNAYLTVLREAAIAELLEDPLTLDVLEREPERITTVCATHILVETEEEAIAVIDRLAGGEEFGDLADELSIDAAPGGDLGCSLASRYVTAFADATVEAPLGEVVGPIETQFGFHVIVVSDRTAPTPQELAEHPADYISSEDADSLWGEWFNDKLQAAEVELDPRYGTWSSVGIVPPDAGGGTTTTTAP